MDHGPGAHHRLIESGHRAVDVTHVFLSHLHYDHCMDYGRLVLQRWDKGVDRISDLEVYGPPPIARMTGSSSARTASMVRIFAPALSIRAASTCSGARRQAAAKASGAARQGGSGRVTWSGRAAGRLPSATRRTSSRSWSAWRFASMATGARCVTRVTAGRARSGRAGARL